MDGKVVILMKTMLKPAVSLAGAADSAELKLDFLPKFEAFGAGPTLGTAGMRISMLAVQLAMAAVIVSL